ncbi:MAG: hypothetical protein KGH54_01950 [Candidatus Micrarchaeota archaeon]|nr:hypothetical protein [Candidatus Micrarchaeota archaeon]
MPTFEFRVLCASDEACKRVRFGMETGLYVKKVIKLPDSGTNLLGTPYSELTKHLRKSQILEKFSDCKHELPMAHYLEAEKHKDHSLQVPCPSCETTLTLVSGNMALEVRDPKGTSSTGGSATIKKTFPVIATVDFEHYDDYPKSKEQKIKILINDHGSLAHLYKK